MPDNVPDDEQQLGRIHVEGLGPVALDYQGVKSALVVAITDSGRVELHCSIPPDALAYFVEVVLERFVRSPIRAGLRSSEAEAMAKRILPARGIVGPNGGLDP